MSPNKISPADLISELEKICKGTNRQVKIISELRTYIHHLEKKNELLNKRYVVLKNTSSRYLDFYDYGPISYFTFNNSGIILQVNLTGAALLGYEREFLIGKHFLDFLQPDSISLFQNHLLNVFTYDNKRNCELKLNAKNNVKLFVSMISVAVKNKNNEILCMSDLIDITESKRVKEDLIQYGEILKKINLKKDIFFSIISHDLRSPFQSILGVTEILTQNTGELTTEEIQKMSSSLHKTLVSHYDLLNNLLHWSKLQLGNYQLNPEEIDLRTKVERVFEYLIMNANQKKIKLVNSIKNNLFLRTDRYMLRSILQNIVSNAIKFTNEGGQVEISASEGRKYVEIKISDTGIGIDRKQLKNLFKIDKRNQTLGTKKESGTGLGLILCKELTEKLNGKISVESNPGSGTSFTILIPRVMEAVQN